jgi:co-chaperonin GroES (HSP10)
VKAKHDEVILRPKRKDVSEGGILLPEVDGFLSPGAIPGEVIAVGPDVDPTIQPGMLVYFHARHEMGAVFEHAGETYSRVLSDDIDAEVTP